MPKPIPAIFATLFIALGLSACAAWQTPGGLTEAPAAEQAATVPAPYVDYWQTRDPSEYRRDAVAVRQSGAQSGDAVIQGSSQSAGTAIADRQPVVASQDVVIQGKDRSVGTAEKSAGSRVRVVVSVRSGKAADVVARNPPKKPEVAVVETTRVATSTAKGNPRLANRKTGKSLSRSAAAAGQDLWGRVRGELRLADVQHPRVAAQIEAFKRDPAYLYLFSRRAKPFLHYLVEQIHRRGLPMDLVFVPMVESAFEPTAVSPKEAAGLWQIIPATGEERGLLIADGYDGRFDIHASTDAALGYLRDLNKMFAGDWLLALAAYNAGPGTVQGAIKASKAVRPGAEAEAQSAAGDPEVATVSDPRPQSLYWDLQLPKETQDYVPKILALAQMVADPQTYGVRLPPIDNRAYLFRVATPPDVKVFDSLAFTALPIDEFLRFNPGFKTEIEPPARAYTLLLPWEQARNLVANVPGARLVGPSKYTVKRGDTLEKIAKRHGVPSRQLAQWNGLSAGGALKAGQQLTVYPAS